MLFFKGTSGYQDVILLNEDEVEISVEDGEETSTYDIGLSGEKKIIYFRNTDLGDLFWRRVDFISCITCGPSPWPIDPQLMAEEELMLNIGGDKIYSTLFIDNV